MGQQPISNDLLVHFLKYHIRREGYTVAGLAREIQVAEDDLYAVLDKRAYATSRLLARLSIPLGPNWRKIAIRYTMWRFDHELAKLDRPAPEAPPRPVSIFDQLQAAGQMITDHPGLDAELLAEAIRGALLLDMGVIRNQIAHIRNQKTGDYHSYG